MGSSYGTFTITNVTDGIIGPQGPQGEQGEPGEDGVNVDRIETEYFLQPQGTAPPTINTEGSLILPDYIPNGTYWVRSITYLLNGDSTAGNWIEDDGLTKQAKQTYDNSQATLNLQTSLRYMWTNFSNSYPKGTYIAAGREQETIPIVFNREEVSTYGFNSFINIDKLTFRYNSYDLTTIGRNGINLYSPLFNSQEQIVGSVKRLGITNSNIEFYNNSEKVLASYSNDGIKFYDGSGDFNSIPTMQIGKDKIIVGSTQNLHIEIDREELGFYNSYNNIEERESAKLSYITSKALYIPYSVVLNEMIVGMGENDNPLWAWSVVDKTQHLRLVWLGGDTNE